MDRLRGLGRQAAEQQREGVGADRVLLGHPGQDRDVAVGRRRPGPPPWSLAAATHPTTVRDPGNQGCPAGGPPRSWWGADQTRPRQRAASIQWPATA